MMQPSWGFVNIYESWLQKLRIARSGQCHSLKENRMRYLFLLVPLAIGRMCGRLQRWVLRLRSRAVSILRFGIRPQRILRPTLLRLRQLWHARLLPAVRIALVS